MLNDTNAAEMSAALQAMRSAHVAERPVSASVREDRLNRLLILLDRYAERFIDTLDRDFGGRSRETSLMNDLLASAESIRYAKKQLRDWMSPERRRGVIPFNLFGARVEVRHVPKGVVGVLGTWNVPLFTVLSPLAFVIAAGNRALVKPSENTPTTSALLREVMKTLLLKRAVLHADETPMPMLKPGLKQTHRSYLWAYGTTAFDPEQMVVYDFAEGRGGQHARAFLGDWRGSLVCDDYQGYDALFREGVTEVGCMAHARRKFHALHENHRSEVAAEALALYGALYRVEREAQELGLNAEERRALRQRKARPVAEQLQTWLECKLTQVPEGSATAKSILYSLRRWSALMRYLEDGTLPIDNNWVENRIRPIALGRNNWLFAGSARAGRRAAVVMSLTQSARLNGHDPYAYLRDVLERLPLTPEHRLEELLPHCWKPTHTLRLH